MSRFRGNISKSKTKKDSKTIAIWGDPIRGDGLDHKKWYRCWNCGFLNNIDRNALGDSQSRDGIVLKDYAQFPEGKVSGDAVLGGGLVVTEDPVVTIRYPLMISESSYGCSFCGSLNWRGDY